MELQLVNFEQAKSLEKLGFPQLDDAQYWYKDNDTITHAHRNVLKNYFNIDGWKPEEAYCAPFLELAAKFLRDKKKTVIYILLFICHIIPLTIKCYMNLM